MQITRDTYPGKVYLPSTTVVYLQQKLRKFIPCLSRFWIPSHYWIPREYSTFLLRYYLYEAKCVHRRGCALGQPLTTSFCRFPLFLEPPLDVLVTMELLEKTKFGIQSAGISETPFPFFLLRTE